VELNLQASYMPPWRGQESYVYGNSENFFLKVLWFVEKFHSNLCCGPSRRAYSRCSKPLSSQNVKSKVGLIPNFNLLVPGVDRNADGLIQTL